jgi:hypothetical protein
VVVSGGPTTGTGAPFFFDGRGLADQASHVKLPAIMSRQMNRRRKPP